MKAEINILLADDHQLVRKGFRAFLEALSDAIQHAAAGDTFFPAR